jgi:hypothetical protein
MKSPFVRDPLALFEEDAKTARNDLKRYMEGFTGSRFDTLADAEHPNRITERDILAVSMLSVNVPAATTIWLLGDGAARVSELLTKIPNVPIWSDEADLEFDTSCAGQLWKLVRQTNWRGPNLKTGMGRTKTSKLLATKRPALIPVWDSVTMKYFFGTREVNDWTAWQQRLRGPEGQHLRDTVEKVRDDVPAAADLSVLRTIDIVGWMKAAKK